MFFALLTSVSDNCLAQISYKGITPGSSVRVDVERVFGKPEKSISPTFAEYNGRPDVTKVFVQYDNESARGIVLRLEMLCELGPPSPNVHQGCYKFLDALPRDYLTMLDAKPLIDPTDEFTDRSVRYFDSPYYLSIKLFDRQPKEYSAQMRIALFTPDLYREALPKGCTGMFWGTWDTDKGRLTIARTKVSSVAGGSTTDYVTGKYSPAGGTITGEASDKILTGSWTDSSGSGDLEFDFPDGRDHSKFNGTWVRKKGTGAKKGTWNGRCIADPRY